MSLSILSHSSTPPFFSSLHFFFPFKSFTNSTTRSGLAYRNEHPRAVCRFVTSAKTIINVSPVGVRRFTYSTNRVKCFSLLSFAPPLPPPLLTRKPKLQSPYITRALHFMLVIPFGFSAILFPFLPFIHRSPFSSLHVVAGNKRTITSFFIPTKETLPPPPLKNNNKKGFFVYRFG